MWNNHPFNIVLADDDESDRMLFKEAFEELQIKLNVYEVYNGTQLMEYLLKEDTLMPSLIFLDLNMPRKNGLECLREIKSHQKLKNIVIAIYSTSASESDIDETFLNGANIYITKPNNFNELKQVLAKAIMVTYQYGEPPFKQTNLILKV